MTSKFDKLKDEMPANAAAREEYDRLTPGLEIASALIAARKSPSCHGNSSPNA